MDSARAESDWRVSSGMRSDVLGKQYWEGFFTLKRVDCKSLLEEIDRPEYRTKGKGIRGGIETWDFTAGMRFASCRDIRTSFCGTGCMNALFHSALCSE